MIDEKKLTKYIQNRINYWEDKAAEYEIVENTEGMDICVEKAMELGAVMRFIKEQSGEEEMKNQFRPKQEITVGGVKFTIIQTGEDWVKCIASECISYGAFDTKNRNNFALSNLREYLNGEFLKSLIEAGAPEEMFEYFTVNLTADDGLRDYGNDLVRVGLITCDEYRCLRVNIPELPDTWWWTATPDSTNDNFVCIVTEIGSLNFEIPFLPTGSVRPVCAFNQSKLKEYLKEQKKIVQIGDFVTYYMEERAEEVLIIYKKGIKIFAVSKTGHLHIIDESINADLIEKTGRHIDLSNILEKIWK